MRNEKRHTPIIRTGGSVAQKQAAGQQLVDLEVVGLARADEVPDDKARSKELRKFVTKVTKGISNRRFHSFHKLTQFF